VEMSQQSVSWSEPVVRSSSAITASEILSLIGLEAITRSMVVGSWFVSGLRVGVPGSSLRTPISRSSSVSFAFLVSSLPDHVGWWALKSPPTTQFLTPINTWKSRLLLMGLHLVGSGFGLYRLMTMTRSAPLPTQSATMSLSRQTTSKSTRGFTERAIMALGLLSLSVIPPSKKYLKLLSCTSFHMPFSVLGSVQNSWSSKTSPLPWAFCRKVVVQSGDFRQLACKTRRPSTTTMVGVLNPHLGWCGGVHSVPFLVPWDGLRIPGIRRDVPCHTWRTSTCRASRRRCLLCVGNLRRRICGFSTSAFLSRGYISAGD
jgi:hypothetical protein